LILTDRGEDSGFLGMAQW